MRSGSDEVVRLVVEDDGPGFGGAPTGRFFTPGLTTKSGGSGLGLTIARAIVEQHGGTLELCDNDGGGGRAEVRLPAASATLEARP
jgi:signal transduction histidine kinase